jgi:hypothetical protein
MPFHILLLSLLQATWAWKFFQFGEQGCGMCGGVKIEDLVGPGDMAIGCISREAMGEVPECPLPQDNAPEAEDNDPEAEDSISDSDSSTASKLPKHNSEQAGGHAGTIFKLAHGRLAKVTYAFDDKAFEDTAERHIEYAKIEYEVYMETWCLAKLDERKQADSVILREVAQHPLRYFTKSIAKGSQAWAPKFFGVCKVTEGDDEPGATRSKSPLYIVQENMLDGYEQACQVDLKLGFNTVEPTNPMAAYSDYFRAAAWKKLMKQAGMNSIDSMTPSSSDGVRLAGFRVFNPFTNSHEKMGSKLSGGFTPIADAVDTMFDRAGHYRDASTMEQIRDKLLGISSWWADEGQSALRAVAMSVLMAYECAPESRGNVFISDIKVQGKLPVMDNGDKADPYVFTRSIPRGQLFPVVNELGGSEETYPEVSNTRPGFGDSLHGEGNVPLTPFVNKAKLGTLAPNWNGHQFQLEYSSQMKELVLDVYDKDDGEHAFIGSIYIQKAEIPKQNAGNESSRIICRSLDTCRQCRLQDVKPVVCFNIFRDESKEPRNSPPPRLKLIDFAHFYSSALLNTTEWQFDGVTEGLLTIVRQMDRKMSESDDMISQNGHKYKCPLAGKKENILTLETCKRYASQRGKKYATWRGGCKECGDGEGACRVCDNIERRRNGYFGHGGEYKVFKLSEAACRANGSGKCENHSKKQIEDSGRRQKQRSDYI